MNEAKAKLLERNVSWNNSRRNFLRVASSTAGAAVVGGLFGCGGGGGAEGSAAGTTALTAAELSDDAKFWAQMRTLFVGRDPSSTLNVDIGAVAPRISVQALSEGNRVQALAAKDGSFSDLAAQRRVIAASLGASSDEVGLTQGTTSGMWAAVAGIQWRKGDAIIFTDHEHPNVRMALEAVARICEVTLHQVTLPPADQMSPEAVVGVFEEEILRQRRLGINTRALLWSSPTYQTGAMLPVKRLAALGRHYELLTLCDAAHMTGMAAVNLKTLGVDFYATSGHKWQSGPAKTGILYVRRDATGAAVTPWRPPYGDLPRAPSDRVDLGAQISRTSGFESAKFDALAASSSLWDSIGRARIEAYVLSQGAYLKQRLSERWGVSVLRSPARSGELLSGITTFDPFASTPLGEHESTYNGFVRRMRETHGFVIRRVALPSTSSAGRHAIRISTPLWIGSPDLDRLVDAMSEVATEMRRGR